MKNLKDAQICQLANLLFLHIRAFINNSNCQERVSKVIYCTKRARLGCNTTRDKLDVSTINSAKIPESYFDVQRYDY